MSTVNSVDNDLIKFRIKLIMMLCKMMNVIKDKTITFKTPVKVMRYYRNEPMDLFEVKDITAGLYNGVAMLIMNVVNVSDENKEQTIGYKKMTTYSIEQLSCESIMHLIETVENHIISSPQSLDLNGGRNLISKGLDDYLENGYFPTK